MGFFFHLVYTLSAHLRDKNCAILVGGFKTYGGVKVYTVNWFPMGRVCGNITYLFNIVYLYPYCMTVAVADLESCDYIVFVTGTCDAHRGKRDRLALKYKCKCRSLGRH